MVVWRLEAIRLLCHRRRLVTGVHGRWAIIDGTGFAGRQLGSQMCYDEHELKRQRGCGVASGKPCNIGIRGRMVRWEMFTSSDYGVKKKHKQACFLETLFSVQFMTIFYLSNMMRTIRIVSLSTNFDRMLPIRIALHSTPGTDCILR